MRSSAVFVLALGAMVGCSTSGRGGTGGGSRDTGPILLMDSGTTRDSGPGGSRDSGPGGSRDAGPVTVRDSGPGGPRDSGPMTTGDGRIGSSCTSAADCREGMMPSCQTDFMGAISFPGGYCTSSCSGPGTCPAGSQCVDIFGSMFCGRTCTSDADCRAAEGYTCGTLPFGSDPTTYCLPPGA